MTNHDVKSIYKALYSQSVTKIFCPWVTELQLREKLIFCPWVTFKLRGQVWIDILSMRILSNNIGCLVGTWNGRVNLGSGSDNELRLPNDNC